MQRRKAFTLIELIAVLVILAVIVTIVTPFIINIMNNAEDHARRRSVDAYGKAVEQALASYELDYGDITTDFNKLKLNYSGNEIICEETIIRSNGAVYLSNCSVSGVKVKDKNTSDGYYHYGSSNREYINKYGLILQEQINEYFENQNELPSDLSSIKNRYSSIVECNIKHINYNNSLYLSQCSVDGKIETDDSTEDGYYHYGNLQSYKIGDQVNYKGIDFYVIKDSDIDQDYVTLLKKTPFTYEEVIEFGSNHINNNTSDYKGIPYKLGKYGAVAYDDSTHDYNSSDISYIVDAWLSSFLRMSDLCFKNQYPARLITYDELISLGCTENNGCKPSKYKWIYSDGTFKSGDNSDKHYFNYWTMSYHYDSIYTYGVYTVGYNGSIYTRRRSDYSNGEVRPVVDLYKRIL